MRKHIREHAHSVSDVPQNRTGQDRTGGVVSENTGGFMTGGSSGGVFFWELKPRIADADRERGAVCEDLQHNVALAFAFLPVGSPNRKLFLGGELRGGVGGAGAHGGAGDHRAERGALPALLPRSCGEAQLPQRAHLHLVGQQGSRALLRFYSP